MRVAGFIQKLLGRHEEPEPPEAQPVETAASVYTYIPASEARRIAAAKKLALAEVLLEEIDFSQKVEAAATAGRQMCKFKLTPGVTVGSIRCLLEPLGYIVTTESSGERDEPIVEIMW